MLMDLQKEGAEIRSSSGPDDMDELPEYSSGGGGTPNRRRPQIRLRNYGAQVDDSSMMMPPESSWSTHGQGKDRAGRGVLAWDTEEKGLVFLRPGGDYTV